MIYREYKYLGNNIMQNKYMNCSNHQSIMLKDRMQEHMEITMKTTLGLMDLDSLLALY